MRRLILALLLLATPAAAAEIKLASWNIAWLTLKPHGHPDLPRDLPARSADDFRQLRHYAQRLARMWWPCRRSMARRRRNASSTRNTGSST